jgi:hypothetical protein
MSKVFNSKIAEVKLLRLLYDNKFNFKTKNRKFKSKSNKKNVKERKFYWIKEIKHKYKTKNSHVFLNNLQELIIKNIKNTFLV